MQKQNTRYNLLTRNKTHVICKNIRANVPCSVFSVLEKEQKKKIVQTSRLLEHNRLKIVRLVANVHFGEGGVSIVFNFKIRFMSQLQYECRSRAGVRIMFSHQVDPVDTW